MELEVVVKTSPLRNLVVIAIAVVAALVTWGVVRLAGIELELKDSAPSDKVSAINVLVTTVVVGLAAWAVHAFLVRRDAARWWPFVGSTVLAISIAGPSWYADGASAVALIAMHLVVGIVLIAGFARLGGQGVAHSNAERRKLQHPAVRGADRSTSAPNQGDRGVA
jgi:hypothetical protein